MAFNSFDPLGSLGGSSGLFDDGSDEARKKNEEMLRRIMQLFGRPGQTGANDKTLFGALIKGYNQGTPLLQEAVTNSKTAGKQALGALAGQGAQAYANIDRQANQARSSARQRGVSSGLFSTSAPLEGGVQGVASNAIGNLGSALGGQFAGQFQQNASATNTALSNLAQYYASKGQGIAGLGQGLAGIMSSYQYQPGQSLFQQISPLLGYGLGGLMGGGFGGGVPKKTQYPGLQE